MTYVETYFTGWVGERILADLRDRLFRHLQRLSLGFYERNRAGVLISRLTNDVEAIDQLVTDGVTSLVQNTLTLLGTAIILFFSRLAARARDVLGDPADGASRPRSSARRSARAYAAGPRAARPRHRDARRGHRGHADGAGVHARAAGARELPRRSPSATASANMQTVVLNGLYFPFVDLLSTLATRSRARLRRPPRTSTAQRRSASSSRSCSTCTTSSTRCSSCRSSTTRSSPRPRRSTRSWACSTRSRR